MKAVDAAAPAFHLFGMTIAENLDAMHASIAEACRRAGRDASSVQLVAVSKTWDAEKIRPALDAGHRHFGENRVQEAQAKWPGLREDFPGVRLHLIGHLQTNKAADAVALFDVIETVDRPKLAGMLAREIAKAAKPVECLIQVNTGEEPQKGGVLPADLDALTAHCRDDLSLDITGLMCIPPVDQEPAPHFAFLAKRARALGLSKLSMGMSADYATAIEQGATLVRVGTAIFGPRSPAG